MARARTSKGNVQRGDLQLETYGLVLLAISVGLLLCLLSFRPEDLAQGGLYARTGRTSNLIGPVGAHLASIFLGTIGLASYLIPLSGFLVGGLLFFRARLRMSFSEVVGYLGLLLSTCVLLHLALAGRKVVGQPPGGLLGLWVGEFGCSLFSGIGTLVLSLMGFLVSGMALTRISLSGAITAGLGALWALLKGGGLWLAGRGQATGQWFVARRAGALEAKLSRASKKRKKKEDTVEAEHVEEEEGWEDDDQHDPFEDGWGWGHEEEMEELRLSDHGLAEETPIEQGEEADGPEAEGQGEREESGAAPVDQKMESGWFIDEEDGEGEPEIIFSDEEPSPPTQIGLLPEPLIKAPSSSGFVLPSIDFVTRNEPPAPGPDPDELKMQAARLTKALADFGVGGKVTQIRPGPVVILFEFLPDPGIKLSKIANLRNDLAMALSARKVRIVAPIPGKGVVGIEVPNTRRETVFLKELLEHDSFTRSKAALPLALGVDIVRNPVVADLAKMPHLLVAGATGSGKSVAINAMIISLLYRHSPETLRMIMVDPKMLEFNIYEGIPHLLLPVVTDSKQASLALWWAVEEMDRRYGMMAELKVRNIVDYNKRLKKLQGSPKLEELPSRHELLPYNVVIIDEFADLMAVSSKEVEKAVCRLAQKARASGIHLLLATQRPSVDVITGLIKANFPARVAFRVAQNVDSRTILGQIGAEDLLGMGDMLFIQPGADSIRRCHAPLVDDQEIRRVVDHIKQQGNPSYKLDILKTKGEGGNGTVASSGGDRPAGAGSSSAASKKSGIIDGIWDEVLYFCQKQRRVSTSRLQRQFKIGYNTAAELMEKLEGDGVVGPSQGAKPRQVLLPPL